jgi:FkbM family methyltransferase
MKSDPFFTKVKNKKRSNMLISLIRKAAYFATKPFWKEVLNEQKKTNFELKKKILSFSNQIKDVANESNSNFKDFDALLNRLNFIEQSLHNYNLQIQEINSEVKEIHNLQGPTSEIIIGGKINSVELPSTSLKLYNGVYGNFALRKSDFVSDYIGSGKFWDEHLHDLIIRYSDLNGVAIDAGAYIGFHSCFLAKYFGKVMSYEPQKKIFNILAANLALNDIENVEIHNVALYNFECDMRIARQENQEVAIPMKNGTVDYSKITNAGAISFEVVSSDCRSVKAYPLDQFELDNVKFIKIDTQGSDFHVLQGAKNTIARNRPVITFEYEVELSKHHRASFEDFEIFFKELNYELSIIRNHENKQFDYLALPKAL